MELSRGTNYSKFASNFCLISLVTGSKRPLRRGWTTQRPLNTVGVEHVLARGDGLGLRLGEQPDGRYLIALDEDTPAAREYVNERRVPLTATILSERGRKLIFALPAGLRVGKLIAVPGLELLGEGRQICLPSPAAPDDRFWIIHPSELEIPAAPAWVVKLIRQSAKKRKPGSVKPMCPVPAAKLNAPATRRFIRDVLPSCQQGDSNAPVQLGAGIIAHRVDGLRGAELVGAMAEVNSHLKTHQRVEDKRLEAIACCIERRRYGFSPAVFVERTGAPLAVVSKICNLFGGVRRAPSARRQLSRRELVQRVRRAVWFAGEAVAPGVKGWAGTEAQLAHLAGVPLGTLHRRRLNGDLPFLKADARAGHGGRLIVVVALGLFAWVWLGLLQIVNSSLALRRDLDKGPGQVLPTGGMVAAGPGPPLLALVGASP